VNRIRWPSPFESGDRPFPKRPYRDGALVYGGMALAIVGLAAATGGSLVRAVLVALGFFVVAMAWTWRRVRLRREPASQRPGEPRP
jgi:Flp pilus assembly protein TadB